MSRYLKSKHPGSAILKYDIDSNASSDYEDLDVRKPIMINNEDLENSTIFNLAAVHTTPGHEHNEYFETNILGATNICDFARKNNIKTIVFTSSIAPYGPSEDVKEETSLPMPNSPYGISKLTAEYIHRVWQAEDVKNRKLIIVRPGVVFGNLEGGNFTRLYKSLANGFFFYPGRKDTIKAAVYVKDVVRILYETSVNNYPGAETYNLTYYPAPTIQEICETMASVTNLSSPKILVPAKMLQFAAGSIYYTGRVLGKRINGIHPDRVKKLMISTNISGKKLSLSPYALKFSLKEAIEDWFNDCDRKELA